MMTHTCRPIGLLYVHTALQRISKCALELNTTGHCRYFVVFGENFVPKLKFSVVSRYIRF